MTPAERQRKARRARFDAALAVTDDLQTATDTALVAALGLRLDRIGGADDAAEGARYAIERIVGELCHRHGIVPDGFVTSRKAPRR